MFQKFTQFLHLLLILLFVKLQPIAFSVQNHSAVFAGGLQQKDNLLEKAQDSYYAADFNKTINLIREFLKNESITKSNRVTAYSLLAKTFVAKNDTSTAKGVIRNILKLEPGFAPTLEQEKPSYVNLVSSVRRKESRSKTKTQTVAMKSGKTKWLWIGAGGAAAAIIVAAVLSNGTDGKSKSLPKPPPFPN